MTESRVATDYMLQRKITFRFSQLAAFSDNFVVKSDNIMLSKTIKKQKPLLCRKHNKLKRYPLVDQPVKVI